MREHKNNVKTGPIVARHLNPFFKFHREQIQEINENRIEIDGLIFLYAGHGTNENKISLGNIPKLRNQICHH